jgi:hypothetical protein
MMLTAQKRVSVAPKGNSFMYGSKEERRRRSAAQVAARRMVPRGPAALLNQFDTKARVCYNTGYSRTGTAGNNTK